MKGKFSCPMLGNNCHFKYSCLQNTRYVTHQEWFIFQICLEMVSGMIEGINSWLIRSGSCGNKSKQNFPETTHWLPWQKEKGAHLMFTRSENIYFNATKLVFVWDTFSWNDPLENNVYKHPRTNSTLLTQAYHQCIAQQVLSASPWPVTAFTKALCSLAISGHFKYLCHEHIAQL